MQHLSRWPEAALMPRERMPAACIVCGDRVEECLPGAELLADTLESGPVQPTVRAARDRA